MLWYGLRPTPPRNRKRSTKKQKRVLRAAYPDHGERYLAKWRSRVGSMHGAAGRIAEIPLIFHFVRLQNDNDVGRRAPLRYYPQMKEMSTTRLDTLNHMAALLAERAAQLEPHLREFRVVCVLTLRCALRPTPQSSLCSENDQKTQSFLPQMP